MKIIFLNTWNGKIKDGIAEFIREQSQDTDIFCFQEAYDEMKLLCRESLPAFTEFSAYKKIEGDDFPQATYVSKKIKEVEFKEVLDGQMDCGLGADMKIPIKDENIHVCNFHGRCQPGHKLDTPERLKQSAGLVEFFKDKKGLKIIGGDMNLLPDTKSIQMFKENGYRNLIKDFDIENTRNRLAWEKYPDNPQYHSDYVFVSPDVKIKYFSVPNIEISDHLPMILEIEV